MRDDWVAVIPAKGEIKAVATALLSLARSPHDVRTDGNGSEFRVPPYLAELYSAPEQTPAPRRRRKKEEGEE
jgi:hypothetical protein